MPLDGDTTLDDGAKSEYSGSQTERYGRLNTTSATSAEPGEASSGIRAAIAHDSVTNQHLGTQGGDIPSTSQNYPDRPSESSGSSVIRWSFLPELEEIRHQHFSQASAPGDETPEEVVQSAINIAEAWRTGDAADTMVDPTLDMSVSNGNGDAPGFDGGVESPARARSHMNIPNLLNAGNASSFTSNVALAPKPFSMPQKRPHLHHSMYTSSIDAHTISKPPEGKIAYTIHSYSSHSADYHPRNIMVDQPNDQSSRWSSGTNNQMQFVMLKLEKVSVVHSITFGKYHKVHVCNMKEFKIFGGMTPDNLVELQHNGLRNDHEPEKFYLKHNNRNVTLPLQYIKIVPLMAWGANFNFSIWYVELNGITDPTYVDEISKKYNEFRETESIRLCLKHLRQRNYMEAFYALQDRTGITIESPLLTELHDALVVQGDFAKAESVIQRCEREGGFDHYIGRCPYEPEWTRIWATNNDGDSPCMRGGHQMCMDVEEGKVYLLGGWNGERDLSDMWYFDREEGKWELLSGDTASQGGPSPRSCHKICYDPVQRQVYVFGRYIDPAFRAETTLNPDFYRYDVDTQRWYRISSDTSKEGGPDLIFDHQMCIDSEKQVLYIFGGRAVHPDPHWHMYSGMYAYDIAKKQWRQISVNITPRIGHSMLFDPLARTLYIFAGQRDKSYYSDFYAYNIDTNSLTEISRDYSKEGGPDAGFTQRATIDCERREFYVLSGMTKDGKVKELIKNSFWVYHLPSATWSRVYQNPQQNGDYWQAVSDGEPCPRFAHQLVYDPKSKRQYLFGGNPGDALPNSKRLDDFWQLKLKRPSSADILRQCLFLIRSRQFTEMCQEGADQSVALHFLQSSLLSVVNHQNQAESAAFRRLAMRLVNQGELNEDDKAPSFQSRTQLFEKLLDFFPDDMREPRSNLIDIVQPM
ncbi:hypothetical protein BZG36_01880 [Bifiguratus adelaidae]|uniref:Muskelin N-terminal domain-containing protein n=1 Tax=Bifiguratus adelaidae TaxID=1938954 RepID=A0A261Y4I7_9FUNG|nr:hypothetical protein BZG36_01880 [Bifiguratus adelaidae]